MGAGVKEWVPTHIVIAHRGPCKLPLAAVWAA